MEMDRKANNKSTKQNGVSQKGHTYEVNEQKMFLDLRKDNQMLLICCRINYSVNLNHDFSSFSISYSLETIYCTCTIKCSRFMICRKHDPCYLSYNYLIIFALYFQVNSRTRIDFQHQAQHSLQNVTMSHQKDTKSTKRHNVHQKDTKFTL